MASKGQKRRASLLEALEEEEIVASSQPELTGIHELVRYFEIYLTFFFVWMHIFVLAGRARKKLTRARIGKN